MRPFAFLSLTCIAALPTIGLAQEQPNILLIIADDMGLHCGG